MKIVGLIPAYNEEKMISSVVTNTRQFVDQVIVMDDGSSDGTHLIAEQAGALVIRNSKNLGLGRTMRKGYIEARKQGADIVVQLDADKQYDPAEIPKLLEPIVQGQADMVLGARLDNLMYDMPAMKRFGNRSFTWILRKLTKEDVRDGQTGFRAIRGEMLDTVLPTNKFSYTQEMILRAAFEGWKVVSVPVHFYQRYDNKSRLFNSSIGFAVRGWRIILNTVRDYHPLKFFGYPGILLYLASTILFISNYFNILNNDMISRDEFLLLNAVLIIIGSQLIISAFIADMMRKKN